MKQWIHKNFRTIVISAFIIPIITVAIVSISHVTMWFGLTNPISWAIYLSVGIEIAALSAIAAISANMGKKVYFPFIVVTLIQFIGNIFFAYMYIDITTTEFKSWVELVSPLLGVFGVEAGDIPSQKRFLAFFSGGMLPIISLTFLHILVKFTEGEEQKPENNKDNENKKEMKVEEIDERDLVSEISRIRPTEEELENLNTILKIKEEEYKNKSQSVGGEIIEKKELNDTKDGVDANTDNGLNNEPIQIKVEVDANTDNGLNNEPAQIKVEVDANTDNGLNNEPIQIKDEQFVNESKVHSIKKKR
jgi:hypothetical protein